MRTEEAANRDGRFAAAGTDKSAIAAQHAPMGGNLANQSVGGLRLTADTPLLEARLLGVQAEVKPPSQPSAKATADAYSRQSNSLHFLRSL